MSEVTKGTAESFSEGAMAAPLPVESEAVSAAPAAVVEPVAPAPAEPVEAEAAAADVVIVPVPAPAKKKGGRPRKDVVKEAAPVAVEVASPTVVEAKAPARKANLKGAKAAAPAKPVAAKPAPAKAVPAKSRSVDATPRKPATVKPAAIKSRVIPAAPAKGSVSAPRKELFIMTTSTTEMTEKFQTAFKDVSEKAKAAFEKSQASLGDVTEFAKGNVEAIVESSKILASGLQELGKGYVTEGKSAVETLTEELKGLAAVKSPTEFFEKQSALLRKQFDAAVASSSKSSEAMLKLANEAFQPISNRVSLAVEKMKQAA